MSKAAGKIVWKQVDQPRMIDKKATPEYHHEMWRTGRLGVKVEKQDFVFYEGVKMVVQLPTRDGGMTSHPECYGEQYFGSCRPRSLGPSVGPAGWYIHRLIDWIPAGLLADQETVVDDVVRWAILQDDPLVARLRRVFPEYLTSIELQLPLLAAEPKTEDERQHHFLVTLKVRATDPTITGAKNQVIAELEELMRWPSPMTIEGIGGVRRIPDTESD